MSAVDERPPLVLSLALVPATLLAATLVLGLLDTLPGLLLGQPRGTRRLASLEEARRQLPRGLLLPAYFPDSLLWPAAGILARTRQPQAVALSFLARGDGREALVLCQTWSPAACPASLLPPLDVFHSVETRVGGQAVQVRAGRSDGRQTWEELSLLRGGRRVTLRLRGRTLDLLRMADSLREERP